MKAASCHIFLLPRKCSVNISVVKTHFCQAFLPHLPGASPRRAFKQVCCRVVLLCHRTLPVTKLWDDWGRILARRLVLCLTVLMLLLYLSHVCNLPLPGGKVFTAHRQKCSNVCVNIETMLRNVLHIASVPEDKTIVWQFNYHYGKNILCDILERIYTNLSHQKSSVCGGYWWKKLETA